MLHALAVTCVTQPASTSASVAKFAIVGVWAPLSESWMVAPQPPVRRSTKLGTLPAAILRPSACPLIAVPSMNWLCVHTVATVVISLIATLAGGCVPTDAINVMAALSPLDGFAAGRPPFAARYRIDPLGADGALIENRPSAPVRARPNCCGLPALAAKSVTVELAIGAPAPNTWPAMFAAVAVVQDTALAKARTAAATIAFALPLAMQPISITRIPVLPSSMG